MVQYCPENYITILQKRANVSSIALEYQQFQILSSEFDGLDVGIEAQKKLSEIELHLTQAHEYYFNNNYIYAIREYETARTLIYQLLYPEVSQYFVSGKLRDLSSDINMFTPLLKAILGLVEPIPPKRIEGSFGPAFPDPRPKVDEAFFVDRGINYANPYIHKAMVSSQLADIYYKRGQWTEAGFFLRQSQSILSRSRSSEAKLAKAALNLSLGAVLIQNDRVEEGFKVLTTALNQFKSLDDLVGQAQVSINMAAGYKKMGQPDKSNDELEKANSILKRIPELNNTEMVRAAVTMPQSKSPGIINLQDRQFLTTGDMTRFIRTNSIQPEVLLDLTEMKGMAVTYRQLGRGEGWSKQYVETKAESMERCYEKEMNAKIGNNSFKVQWNSGSPIPHNEIIHNVYEKRIDSLDLADVDMEYVNLIEFALVLNHQFYFVIPVAMADCFRKLGRLRRAFSLYLMAADYPYINRQLEAPNLWLKIAEMVLDWGDMLCNAETAKSDEDYREAISIYRYVIEPPGSPDVVWADSPLYKHPNLKPVGDKVKVMLDNLGNPDMRYNNPALVAVVLTIRARLLGMKALNIPIWSFDYLQSVATHFAQRAIQAERDYVNFIDKAEQEGFTLKELEQAIAMAEEEVGLANRQVKAAEAELSIYEGLIYREGKDGRVEGGQIFHSKSARFIDWIYPDAIRFDWEKIPGDHNERLIEFIKLKYRIVLNSPIIVKPNRWTLEISDGDDYAWLQLFHGKYVLSLQNNNTSYEFASIILDGEETLFYPANIIQDYLACPPDIIRIESPSDGISQIYEIESIDSETQLTLKTQPPVGSDLQWSLHRKSTTVRWINALENYNNRRETSDEQIKIATAIALYSGSTELESIPIKPYIEWVYWIGEKIPFIKTDVRKTRRDLVSEKTQRGQEISAENELALLANQACDLSALVLDSQKQLDAANSRVEAARQMEQVAKLRKEFAVESKEAFEKQFFTPYAWNSMGNFVYNISKSYLSMAVQVAQMMQRAYNFENDTDIKIIKKDYSNKGITIEKLTEEKLRDHRTLLAADALLLDIESFTYDMITTKRKELQIKQTISLAERYPFLFETSFRQTGRIDFDTRMADFDMAYPGIYGGRIENMEVEIDGLLPRSGIKGTLTNSGISRYRTSNKHEIKFRLQPRETMVLSEYRLRGDSMVYPSDPRKLKVFEGAGVAGSWTLEIPRYNNDLDFNSIVDVRLVFYYRAKYDEMLAQDVKDDISQLQGIYERSRILPLRWIFPDAFFHFQDYGSLEYTLNEMYFPFNELNPIIRRLGLIIMVEPGVDPSGWKIRLGTPDSGEKTYAASPNPNGEIIISRGEPSEINHSWAPLLEGKATGDYKVVILGEENPTLIENEALKLDKIKNIVMIMDYSFTPRE